ncbi:hypothetical protein Cgig2_022836 [Carnegiea gigantea]|uniref:GDSL esterase/lipase n=1 Tax=Carnegiea gigantea TaxID=171969 RepID=A0A9Q1KQZ6_9CARY|nr:hypothetical protein Cgig2_022836 [Carnegiea gigantea]
MRGRKRGFSLSYEALLLLTILGLQFLGGVSGGCEEAPVMFSFGDSNADTGGLAAGLGFPVNPPNGRSFFGRSTGRLSDGRLVIDFLCKFPPLFSLLATVSLLDPESQTHKHSQLHSDDQIFLVCGQSLNTSFLNPYLESVGSNFHNGANFAVVGSSTLPKYVPFALNIQIMQFLHFKTRSLELAASGGVLLVLLACFEIQT